VLSLEPRTTLPNHFSGDAAAAKGRQRPDVGQIGIADFIRQCPRGGDELRLSPRDAFYPGDADREAVFKGASRLLGERPLSKRSAAKSADFSALQSTPAVSDA